MKKIDMHMHTDYSDGALTVPELLANATTAGLDTIAITDHNNVDAYFELENNNYSSIFKGKIIKGVEIYSYYKGKTIEFLVYDYDISKMKEFLSNKYGKSWGLNRINTVLNKLKVVATNLDLTFDKNFTIETNVGECAQFFKHLMTFKENERAFSEDVLSGKKSFFRSEVCNVNSPFYVDYGAFYVTPKEIIDFVNETSGKIFLAHLYEYNLENPTELLDHVKDLGVSGIECYHPIFTKEQCKFLLDYTKKNNLLKSGGSDFHGGTRPNILGVLNSSTDIDYSVFDWTKSLENMNKTKGKNYGN